MQSDRVLLKELSSLRERCMFCVFVDERTSHQRILSTTLKSQVEGKGGTPFWWEKAELHHCTGLLQQARNTHAKDEGKIQASSTVGPCDFPPPVLPRLKVSVDSISYPLLRTCLLILERGGGRERERERNLDVRERHQSVFSWRRLDQDLTPNLGMCPDWESNPWPFSLWDVTSTDWATPAKVTVSTDFK